MRRSTDLTMKFSKSTNLFRFSSFVAFVLLAVFVVSPRAAGKSDVADAAMRGDVAAVRALIAQKADVNAPQNDGATAMHWAAFNGNRDLAVLLLRAGANPKAANREGVTPLWLASVNGDETMVRALIEGGADANETLDRKSVV